VHLSFFAVGALLLWLNARGSGRFVFFWRVWYIPFLYVFLFEEVGRMIRPGVSAFFDPWVLAFEAKAFGGYPTVWLQSLATPWLTEVMSSFYMSYYFLIPALGLNLYWHGELTRLNDFILTTSVTFFFCFLHYLLMPVAGPIFLTDGLPFQLVSLSGGRVTVFEQWLFYRGAIQGGAFPSSHVAVAMVVLLFAFRYGKFPYVFMAAVTGLAVSTVYNGYHYGVDVLYGLATGLAFYLLCPFLNKAWSR
jgi:membrane-associated phospholipid phosphatase